MFLTISTTYSPASDLGFLLHKNPARLQTFDLSFGKAHVFYPQATGAICTVGLLLDVDVIGGVRGRRGERTLEHYVSDRPYVASSFLSVAIGRIFRDALNGTAKERPELAQTPIPLCAKIPIVPARGGEEFLRALCSSRWAGKSQRKRTRWTKRFPLGARAATIRSSYAAKRNSAICWRIFMFCCLFWTTKNITGSAMTKLNNCCDAAKAGWAIIRSAKRSCNAICVAAAL